MKRFLFIAEACLGGVFIGHRVEVEATSEPEAIYEAKRDVEKWLSNNGPLTTADLKRFDLVSVRSI